MKNVQWSISSEADNFLDLNAYSVGFILGDGCLKYATRQFKPSHNITHHYAITASKPDKDCIEHVVSELQRYHKNIITIGEPALGKGRTQQMYKLGIVNKDLWETFYYYTDGKKRIPDYYFTASRGVRLDLLRGLMDSDGHVSYAKEEFKNPEIGFSNNLPLLIDDYVRLITGLGYLVSSIKEDKRRYPVINYVVRLHVYKAHQLDNPFYGQRKREKWAQWAPIRKESERSETKSSNPLVDMI